MSDKDTPAVAACPFCGGEPEIIRYSVHCNSPFCEAQPFTSGQSRAEGIAAWNRRASPVPAPASPLPADLNAVRVAITPGAADALAAASRVLPPAPAGVSLTEEQRSDLSVGACVFGIPPYDKNPQSQRIAALMRSLAASPEPAPAGGEGRSLPADTEAIPEDERDRLIAEAAKVGIRYNGTDFVLPPPGIDSNELLNLMTGIPLPARYGTKWPQRAASPSDTPRAADVTGRQPPLPRDLDPGVPRSSGVATDGVPAVPAPDAAREKAEPKGNRCGCSYWLTKPCPSRNCPWQGKRPIDAAAAPALAPPVQLSDGYRKCEFCGCNTNAKERACCKRGFVADRALRAARALLSSPERPSEPPSRWRWVDCTPHAGYFEKRVDGRWVRWADVAHLFAAPRTQTDEIGCGALAEGVVAAPAPTDAMVEAACEAAWKNDRVRISRRDMTAALSAAMAAAGVALPDGAKR